MLIKKIFIKNFMSVGKDAISINFDEYKDDDIVIIKGENTDVSPLASNGAGKCVDKDTQINIKYDSKEIIELIGINPFSDNKSTVGNIVNLFEKYPRLKSKILVESKNNTFQLIENAKKTYRGRYYTIVNEYGDKLLCSPNHILFDKYGNECMVKNIKIDDLIETKKGLSKIIKTSISETKKDLFDIQVNNTHMYYSNNYLSHNSLLQEAISFGLFGKTIREIEKTDDCINNLTKKDLLIEIEVDDIKIVRQRKPNKLELFVNDENITLSSMSLTQDMIENKLKINHHTFINTFCFGQHNSYSFLSLKKAEKRKIIEDILQLCEYNRYEENSRRYSRDIKSKVSEFSSIYERNKKEITIKQNQINEYKQKLINFKIELEKQISNIENKIKEIDSIDIQSELNLWELYEQAIKDANVIIDQINKLDSSENGIKKLFLDYEKEYRNNISPIKNEIEKINKDILKISKLQEGVRCGSCYQVIDKKNYQELQKKLESDLIELQPQLDKFKNKYHKFQAAGEKKLLEINEEKKELLVKKNILSKTKKSLFSKESLMKKQIEKSHLESICLEKQSQLDKNPYHDIILDLKNNLSEAQNLLEENIKELKKYEELLPYYNFWVNGFGDTGVKSFVIEQIIPVLNQQINYWLQFLIDNNIIVKFDKFLNVEITRPNNLGTFTYGQGSGGEKKRIDLAITLAFAYITKLRSNSNNNIIFLDELAESIDVVEGIQRTLKELSKDYTVFLITHRPDLLNSLENKKKIIVKKENGFSKLINSINIS